MTQSQYQNNATNNPQVTLEKNTRIGNQKVTAMPVDEGYKPPPRGTFGPHPKPEFDLTPKKKGAMDGIALPDTSTSSASTGKATMQSVGSNELVRNQMTGLMSENSKYMQLARRGAMNQANSRGLMNSSIAAGAGEDAAIRSALPIAQQDAQTNFNTNTNNTNWQNKFAENSQQQGFNMERDSANANYQNQNTMLQGKIQAGRDEANAGYNQELEQLRSDNQSGLLTQEGEQRLEQLEAQSEIQARRDETLQNYNMEALDQQQQNTVINQTADFAHQIEQTRMGISSQFQGQYLDSSSRLMEAWSAEVQAVYSNSDMTPAQQLNAINEIEYRYTTRLDELEVLYEGMGLWNLDESPFPDTDGTPDGPPSNPSDPNNPDGPPDDPNNPDISNNPNAQTGTGGDGQIGYPDGNPPEGDGGDPYPNDPPPGTINPSTNEPYTDAEWTDYINGA